MYHPDLNITVDECLVGFRGRCTFKQYMPSKPAKYGIKIWAACDAKTSYCFNMQVYTGKPAGAQHEKNLSKRTVLEMMNDLQGHIVTCDNCFYVLCSWHRAPAEKNKDGRNDSKEQARAAKCTDKLKRPGQIYKSTKRHTTSCPTVRKKKKKKSFSWALFTKIRKWVNEKTGNQRWYYITTGPKVDNLDTLLLCIFLLLIIITIIIQLGNKKMYICVCIYKIVYYNI